MGISIVKPQNQRTNKQWLWKLKVEDYELINPKNMKKKKPIYLLAPELKWKAFKELQDRLVKDSGPVPVQGDKALWGLNKKHLIYCWFDPYIKNNMRLGLKLPKNRVIKIITNPTIN